MILYLIFPVLVINFGLYSSLSDEKFLFKWNNYKLYHGKKYENETEHLNRMQIYKVNLKKIIHHNKLYKLGIHSYSLNEKCHIADKTIDELLKNTLQFNENMFKNVSIKKLSSSLQYIPEKIDWRHIGAVTPVKNTKSCQCCYSMAATAVLESRYFIKMGKLIPFSAQQFIDCSRKFKNNGCVGGSPQYCFEYAKKNGIVREEDYPYKEKENKCLIKNISPVIKVKSYEKVQEGNEKELMEAVAKGPVTVGIHARSPDFECYKDGYYYDPVCKSDLESINHAVVIVGYGKQNGKDYWLVRNSWGPEWGERGYIKMARNRKNNCGIATRAIYPILNF